MKMLVTFFFLIHGLLARVICRPWDIDFDLKMTDQRRLNVRVVCSTMYHLIMENFEGFEGIPGNDSHLNGQQKTIRTPALYLFGKE